MIPCTAELLLEYLCTSYDGDVIKLNTCSWLRLITIYMIVVYVTRISRNLSFEKKKKISASSVANAVFLGELAANPTC